MNVAWADPGKDLAAALLANGLTSPQTGIRAVEALSQPVHDAVDGAQPAGRLDIGGELGNA